MIPTNQPLSLKITYKNIFVKTGFLLFLVFLSVLTSLVIVFAGFKMTLYLIGLICSTLFIFLPSTVLLVFLLFYVFIFLGPLNALVQIDTIWAPYGMMLGLLILSVLHKINNQKKLNPQYPAFLWSFILFLLISISSTILTTNSFYPLLLSVRSLFFVWGIYYIVLYSYIPENYFKKAVYLFIVFGIVQVPFTVYQRFWIVPTRVGGPVWDSVLGTFPGNGLAGDSGGMAFFLISLIVIVYLLWKNQQLKGYKAFLFSILFLIPISLGEIKISYVLLPIMLILAMGSEIRKNPLFFIIGSLCSVLFVAFIFLAGQNLNFDRSDTKSIDIEKEFDNAFNYSTSTKIYNGANLDRTAILNFWWQKNKDEPLYLIIGHGLGSTVAGNGLSKSGSVAFKFRPYNIANTRASKLLWETGLIGLASYIGIFLFGAIKAYSLSKSKQIPAFHQALLHSSSVILISSLVMIPYNSNTITVQVFLIVLLANVGYWIDKSIEKKV